MTTLAVPPAHLMRLFDRIDAADAKSEHLREALDFWHGKRGDRVLPTEADLASPPEATASHTFLFRRSETDEEDWDAVRTGHEAADLIGLEARGRELSKLTEPRIAVRLRRLFEMAAETGEPVAAMFEIRGRGGRREWVEVLAAPLSTNAINVDGIFGGIMSRREATKPPAR